MIKEEEYLKAKQIVQKYEKQLNISVVMWRCLRDLKDDWGKTCFIKNEIYIQYPHDCDIALLNENMKKHVITKEWRKYFVNAT